MNDNLKFDESQKKRCWGCAFFSTSPNWAPVGSGSSEYSCYLHGGSHIRKVGSGSCFCDCWEKKLIDTEGYDVESDKSYYEKREVHEAIRELKKKFEMLIADKDAEIAELKQKLAEKDLKIAEFKDKCLNAKDASHVLKAFNFYLCQLTHCAYDECTAQWIIDNWEQDYDRVEAYKG